MRSAEVSRKTAVTNTSANLCAQKMVLARAQEFLVLARAQVGRKRKILRVFSEDGTEITEAQHLLLGQYVRIFCSDGEVTATIKRIKLETE